MRNFNQGRYFNALSKFSTNRLEKFKGCSILITGANGLIGGTILDFFQFLNETCDYNISITVLVRGELQKHKFFDYDKINIINSDINVFINCDTPFNYIFHAASNAHPKAYTDWPVETALTNIIGTKNLIELAQRYNARLIFISSSEVYGEDLLDREFRAEKDFGYIDINTSRACYSESKRMAETLISCYISEYDLDAIIVRPAYIYGPRFSENNTRADVEFIKNALTGENIVLRSEGLQKRSYCYVLDCCYATLLTALLGEKGEAYNISSDSGNVLLRDFALKLAKKCNVNVEFQLEKVSGGSPVQNSLLNNEKLKSLGWSEIFTLDSGIDSTIELLSN